MPIFYYLPTYNQHILGFVIWVVIYDLGLLTWLIIIPKHKYANKVL